MEDTTQTAALQSTSVITNDDWTVSDISVLVISENSNTENQNDYYRAGWDGQYDGRRDGIGRGRSVNFLHNKWAKTRTAVDRRTTGKKLIEIFGPHTSEASWCLPQDHPRHILQFPTDIFNRILSFCLVTDKEVTPLTVACNWMPYYQEPSYILGITGDILPFYYSGTAKNIPRPEYLERWTINGVDHHHRKSKNKYVTKEYSGYTKRAIDATILRVSRLFYQEGRPLLYGDNEFVFNVEDYIGPLLDDFRQMVRQTDGNWKMVRRDRSMPEFSKLETEEVQNSIRDMVNVQDPEALDDWIYCDLFARFLYSIGPTNASFIKKLRFVGSAFPAEEKEHIGRVGYEKNAFEANLAYYLKAYAPFMLHYCQNLVKLGIGFSCFQHSYWNEQVGEMSHEDWFVVDLEDEEMQDGDESFEDNYLKIIRELRRANRKRKYLEARKQYEKGVALNFKPFIDALVPKLKKLQVLEVKRKPSREYCTEYPLPTVVSTYKKFTDTIPWVDMEMAEEAKRALAIAVFKRSQEMEAAEKMVALALSSAPGALVGHGNAPSQHAHGSSRYTNNTWGSGTRGRQAPFPGRGRERVFRGDGSRGYRGPGIRGNLTRGGSSSRGGGGIRGGHTDSIQATMTADQNVSIGLGAQNLSSSQNNGGGPTYRGRGGRGGREGRGHNSRGRRGM